jgi:succinate dehydrogenase / fumarate reductase cytochrome b subunit
MTTQRSAPVYLNLLLLDISLQGPEGYADAIAILGNCWLRLGSAAIAWSLFHHLLSGIRFLFIDIEAGVTLKKARTSAWLVNFTGLVLTLAYVWWIS